MRHRRHSLEDGPAAAQDERAARVAGFRALDHVLRGFAYRVERAVLIHVEEAVVDLGGHFREGRPGRKARICHDAIEAPHLGDRGAHTLDDFGFRGDIHRA